MESLTSAMAIFTIRAVYPTVFQREQWPQIELCKPGNLRQRLQNTASTNTGPCSSYSNFLLAKVLQGGPVVGCLVLGKHNDGGDTDHHLRPQQAGTITAWLERNLLRTGNATP